MLPASVWPPKEISLIFLSTTYQQLEVTGIVILFHIMAFFCGSDVGQSPEFTVPVEKKTISTFALSQRQNYY